MAASDDVDQLIDATFNEMRKIAVNTIERGAKTPDQGIAMVVKAAPGFVTVELFNDVFPLLWKHAYVERQLAKAVPDPIPDFITSDRSVAGKVKS